MGMGLAVISFGRKEAKKTRERSQSEGRVGFAAGLRTILCKVEARLCSRQILPRELPR